MNNSIKKIENKYNVSKYKLETCHNESFYLKQFFAAISNISIRFLLEKKLNNVTVQK